MLPIAFLQLILLQFCHAALGKLESAVKSEHQVTHKEAMSPPFKKDELGADPICLQDVPDPLSFLEPLYGNLKPEHIVIFTGGESFGRRQEGFAKLSANALDKFAKYHGYSIVFLDQLDYDRSLKIGEAQFTGHWHRVFAMPDLRKKYSDAKYFVWFDDDVLAPYPETDMLNHYVNLMEKDEEWQMLYGEEAEEFVLNSGMFIIKNTDFCFDAYRAVIDIGLEKEFHLATQFGYEQGAMVEYRRHHNLHSSIRVIEHRSGPYNFNTFNRMLNRDTPGTMARIGDAFVHFLGLQSHQRLYWMKYFIGRVEEWRKPRMHCKFPVSL